jgi:Protein of unknown function (DUF2975)
MKNFQNKTKIIKVSKIFRNISFAGLVYFGIFIPLALVAAVMPPLLSKQITFSLTQFLVIPIYVICFMTNLKIFRFLDRLKNGCFFDAQTVGNLNAAANWWLMLWIYEVVNYVLMQQPWNNPHDFSLDHFPPDVGSLFAALTLKFFAWFFREAQELQAEQALTV